MKILTGILGIASTLSTFYLTVTLLMDPKYRNYPGILIVFVCVSTFILCSPFALGALVGLDDMLCIDEYTKATMNDNGYCAYIGFSLTFGGVFSALAWTSVSFNTFAILFLRWPIDPQKWLIISFGCIFVFFFSFSFFFFFFMYFDLL
jgi:hypothetical protein